MTHMREMSESEGTFDNEKPTFRKCRKCGADGVTYRTWESSDGGYEDEKFTCHAPGCGYTWWVEGIDS